MFIIANQKTVRHPYQRHIVDPNHDGVVERATPRANLRGGLEKWNSPRHALYSSHPLEHRVAKRIGHLDGLYSRIHDPDIGLRNIVYHAGCPGEQPKEDRYLLAEEERAQGHTKHETQAFGRVTEEHPQRDDKHADLLKNRAEHPAMFGPAVSFLVSRN